MLKETKYPHYFVSDDGKVYSNKSGMMKELSRVLHPHGYFHVGLCVKGHKINRKVHKLVIEAFLGECPEGKEVDHINRIRTDNRLENLRYVSRKENCANRKEYKHNNPNPKKPVRCIETGKLFSACTEAALFVNDDKTHISRSCKYGNGVRGYHFVYA